MQKKVAALLGSASLFEAEYRQARTSERRCGRLEEREITVAVSCKADLSTYLDFTGVKQVFQLTRRTQRQHPKRGGIAALKEETIWGVTSLSATEASPDCLLSLIRGHWHIENRSHWVRDVTFDEDRSQVRVGNIPQVMTSFRNTAISLMRLAGYKNVAAACRLFAAKPEKAIKLIRGRTE